MHKAIISVIGSAIPLGCLRKQKNLPPVLPFYHAVSDVPLPYIHSYPVRSAARFEEELDFLLQHFKPVTLSDIVQYHRKNDMHLSFDDGLKSCYTTIAPLLKRKGIPATFFVNEAFVDNRRLFHRFKRAWLETTKHIDEGGKKYWIHETHELDNMALQQGISWEDWLVEHCPFMSLEEIKLLHRDGFTIGAHSIDHPEFWLIDEEEQFRQIAQSMDWVIRNFNPPIRAFAFPFTDDQVSLSLFRRINEANITDVTFGTAGLKHDSAPNHFHRIPIEHQQNWGAQKVVHFEFFYYFVRSLLNRNRVTR
jgi:peptidoglycan/xylan/chitin deacetylase (PgdA/CDA1 family)